MTRDERLERVEHRQQRLSEVMTELLNSVGEQNLRVRFVMEHFKFERPAHGGLLVGGKVEREVATLLDLYLGGGRNQILAIIQQELLAAQAEAEAARLQQEGTNGTPTGENGAQSAEGDDAAGEPATSERAPGARASAADGYPRRLRPVAKASTH